MTRDRLTAAGWHDALDVARELKARLARSDRDVHSGVKDEVSEQVDVDVAPQQVAFEAEFDQVGQVLEDAPWW